MRIVLILASLLFSIPAAADWEVCIERASVLPVKTDGRPWDGIGPKVSSKTVNSALVQVMTGNPQGAAVMALAQIATGKGVPDPRGMLTVNGKTVLTTHHHKNDLIPVWPSSCATLTDKQAKSGKISLLFQDRDAFDDDMIGSVLFVQGFPADALKAGKWEGRGTQRDALVSATLTFRKVTGKKKRRGVTKKARRYRRRR